MPSMKLAFDELIEKFKLNDNNPSLDCIDISHHSGSNPKAGIIRFNINGPDKNLYRSYNLPKELGGNDPGSVAFAINKRLEKGDENPSILLVDGGKAQLNAITKITKDIDILVLAIEKGSQRKALTENIYSVNGQETVDVNSKLFNLLIRARDEAHRFAIKNNRISKQSGIKNSSLDKINGVGAVIKSRLFQKFGSIKYIRRARIDEITKIKGVSEKLANKIHTELNNLYDS